MIQPFAKYISEGKVRRGSADRILARSLIANAGKLLKYAKKSDITEEFSTFIFGDAYEAAREAIQSLMAAKGFKPYSHEATLAFAKEYYPDQFNSRVISEFDRLRRLGNDSKYRAKEVGVEDAKEALSFSANIIKKSEEIIKQIL